MVATSEPLTGADASGTVERLPESSEADGGAANGRTVAAFDLKPDGLPMVATGGRLPESLPDRLTGGAAHFLPTVAAFDVAGIRRRILAR